MADCHVAVSTQKPPHLFCLVVVVDSQHPDGDLNLAYRTAMALKLKKSLVSLPGQSVPVISPVAVISTLDAAILLDVMFGNELFPATTTRPRVIGRHVPTGLRGGNMPTLRATAGLASLVNTANEFNSADSAYPSPCGFTGSASSPVTTPAATVFARPTLASLKICPAEGARSGNLGTYGRIPLLGFYHRGLGLLKGYRPSCVAFRHRLCSSLKFRFQGLRPLSCNHRIGIAGRP